MLECHDVSKSSTGTLDGLPSTRAQIFLFGASNFKASVIVRVA
jgi:hypothetical protein